MKLRFVLLILAASLTLHPREINAQTGNNAAGAVTNPPAPSGTNDVPEVKPPGEYFTNFVGMEFIKAPGGFWAGKYEVTQKQFRKVMDVNPSAFIGDDRPVDSVTWNEAMDFCKVMTRLDLKKKILPEGFYYALPTEDEWKSLVADASLDTAVTSLNGNFRSQTSPVGSTPPNSLGLYDVLGNVMEFCDSDDSKPYRFLKGGSWQDRTEDRLRPDFRWYCKPDERLNAFGFRCLLKSK